MRTSPLPSAVKHRVLFLLAGNLVLFGAIGLLLKEGSSLWQVVLSAGPNLAPVVLAAVGMTAVVYVGAIDLSIASAIAVAAVVFASMVERNVPAVFAHLLCWGTVCLLLTANGLVVRLLNVPAIIVTLAGLAFYRGLSLILAELLIPGFGGSVAIRGDAYHAPGERFSWVILLGCSVAALLWDRFSLTARRWLGLGSSEEATRTLGISHWRVMQSAFVFNGVFLGVAAVLFISRLQYVEPARIAAGFELQVIGAVILGGTNIFGGEGSFLGTMLGAIFLYLAWQLMVYAGVSAYLQDVITGALILGVIGADCALHRKSKLMEELT